MDRRLLIRKPITAVISFSLFLPSFRSIALHKSRDMASTFMVSLIKDSNSKCGIDQAFAESILEYGRNLFH